MISRCSYFIEFIKRVGVKRSNVRLVEHFIASQVSQHSVGSNLGPNCLQIKVISRRLAS